MPANPITVNVDTHELAEELKREAEGILNALLKVPAGYASSGAERFVDCVIGAAALTALNGLAKTLRERTQQEGTNMRKTRSWYGTCGTLITDRPVPGVAEDRLTPEEEQFYGAPYLIAESMTEPAACKISELLGLEYCGERYLETAHENRD